MQRTPESYLAPRTLRRLGAQICRRPDARTRFNEHGQSTREGRHGASASRRTRASPLRCSPRVASCARASAFLVFPHPSACTSAPRHSFTLPWALAPWHTRRRRRFTAVRRAQSPCRTVRFTASGGSERRMRSRGSTVSFTTYFKASCRPLRRSRSSRTCPSAATSDSTSSVGSRDYSGSSSRGCFRPRWEANSPRWLRSRRPSTHRPRSPPRP